MIGLLAGWSAVPTGLALAASLSAPMAHPMGNFSVNQYHEIGLHPDRVAVAVVVDSAEIPTLAQRGSVDADGSGLVSDLERADHAARVCADAAAGLSVRVGADALVWTITGSSFDYAEGAGGLDVSRLESGQPVADQKVVDTMKLIRNAIRDVSPVTSGRRQELLQHGCG